MLKPGESQAVSFIVTEDDLKFYDEDGSFQAEIGAFRLFVGSNSRDLLSADFELV